MQIILLQVSGEIINHKDFQFPDFMIQLILYLPLASYNSLQLCRNVCFICDLINISFLCAKIKSGDNLV